MSDAAKDYFHGYFSKKCNDEHKCGMNFYKPDTLEPVLCTHFFKKDEDVEACRLTYPDLIFVGYVIR